MKFDELAHYHDLARIFQNYVAACDKFRNFHTNFNYATDRCAIKLGSQHHSHSEAERPLHPNFPQT